MTSTGTSENPDASKREFIKYPSTTSFRPPKKYFVLFYLLSSPVVLVIALYYL